MVALEDDPVVGVVLFYLMIQGALSTSKIEVFLSSVLNDSVFVYSDLVADIVPTLERPVVLIPAGLPFKGTLYMPVTISCSSHLLTISHQKPLLPPTRTHDAR